MYIMSKLKSGGNEKKCGMEFNSHDDLEKERHKISNTSFFYDKNQGCASYYDNGVWLQDGAENFPVRQFDLAGYNANNWKNVFENSKRVFNFLKHSSYDNDINDSGKQSYYVDVELLSVRASTSTEENSEWYIGHHHGYLMADGTHYISALEEKPKGPSSDEDHCKDCAKANSSNNYTFNVNYHYPQMLCLPNTGIVFTSRAFERDGKRVPIPEVPYKGQIETLVDILKDIRKAATSGRYGPIIYDLISVIAGALIDNSDDPMNPALTIFSNGACRFFHEQCGGTINFHISYVKGMKAENVWLSGTPNYQRGQKVDENGNRHIDLHYKVTIKPANITVTEGEYSIVQSKTNGLVWKMEGGDLVLASRNDNDINQHFKFEKQNNGQFYIRSKASGAYLCGHILPNEAMWGVIYHFYLTDKPDIFSSFSKVAESGGGYRIRLDNNCGLQRNIYPNTSDPIVAPTPDATGFSDNYNGDLWDLISV